MANTWKSQSDDAAVSLLWGLSVILAAAACVFLLLYALFKPTVLANPGLGAYTPPPGTRLIPLFRKSDAPELAALPAEPPSPLTALAQAQASEAQANRDDVRPPARKRPRIDPREYEQRGFGYSQQWNGEYRDWNNNRARSGISRSWFQ